MDTYNTNDDSASAGELNAVILDEINRDIANLYTSEEILEVVCNRLGKHLRLSGCHFMDVDDGQKEAIVHFEWTNGNVPSVKDGFRFRNYFSEELVPILSTGKPFIVRDTQNDDRVAAKVHEKMKIGAIVGIPYHWQGRWTRIISATTEEPRDWMEGEISILANVFERFNSLIERIRVAEALKVSEEKYRTLFESMDEGFAIVELVYDEAGKPCDERYIEVNNAFERLFGYMNAEGKLLSEISPNVKAYWLEDYDNVVQTGEALRTEYLCKKRNRWFCVHIAKIKGLGVRQCALLINDITERKHAELRQLYLVKLIDAMSSQPDEQSIQNAVTRLLVEHLGVSQSSYADYKDDIIKVNCESGDGTLSIKGEYDRKALPGEMEILNLGKEIIFTESEQIEPPKELQKFFISMNIRSSITVPILKNGKLVATLSVRQSTPRKWYKNEIDLVRETAERTWIAIERIRAEKDRRESEARAIALVKKLEESDRNKNRFINTLSHELRNPLAVIMAGLEMLEISKEPEQVAKFKKIVNRHVSQLNTLVDSLLELTRVTNNKIELQVKRLELNSLVALIAEDVQTKFNMKDITLHTNTFDEEIFVEADSIRIQQAIVNLLNNAYRYSRDENGEVILSVYIKNQEAVISVKDNGIGLDPELIPNIFSPFVQADTSLERNDGGLGIGLSITKEIVELHGGSVGAYSKGLWKGSEFFIYLPLSETEV